MNGFMSLLFMAFLSFVSMAGDCVKTGSVCIDSTPCKTISGQSVCLAQHGLSCWQYQDTYTCLKPNSINYCQTLIDAQPQCWQTNSKCAQMDAVFNSGCMKHTQTWRCADPSTPTPSNTTRLDDTYTLISSDYDPGPCQSLADNPSCQIAESQCLSTTPPSLPASIDPATVAPDGCYQKQNTYACLTGRTDSSECDGYASNPNCNLQSTAPCADEDQIGEQCSYQRQTYRCVSTPAQTRTVTDCSGQQFCQGGNCFDKGYENDPDFARSMALMEAAREAGVYGDTASIFGGKDSRCTVNQFGLSNCCKKSGGGQSNSAVMGVAISAGGQALKYGSSYVYDALFTSDAPNWMVSGLGSMIGANPNAGLAVNQFSPTLSLYGLTATTGTLATTNMFGGAIQPLGSFGGVNFGFDPYSLAFSVAIMIIQDMLSCDPDEQILSMKLGQNLCHEVGDYCSNRFLGKCITKTRAHCCYNSRLARIINEQGRSQIGKSWGSAQSPNCSGFTTDEFASVDFSRVDLSEFVTDVLTNFSMPNASGISQDVQGTVQNKMQNYYQRSVQ